MWIDEFVKERGRKPRILHIGNIANNAYQNAKILNANGCDCDVLSFDYYHIMSCPEWADAEFDGNLGNPNFPKWNKVNLHGFKRPKWFVAGPTQLCIKYLLAKREEKIFQEKIYGFLLKWARNDIAKNENANNYSIISISRKLSVLKRVILIFISILEQIIKRILGGGKSEKNLISKGEKSQPRNLKDIEKEFEKLFPDRKCEFGELAKIYMSSAHVIKPLLDKYDLVIMYATNPIIAYLAGYENYVAYEHGTLRDLPFEDSEMGRLMLLSYACAKSIYVTNIDCYEKAKYISKNKNTPIICGLHGIDIDGIVKKMDKFKSINNFDPRFGISKDETLFFCASRHDYDESRNAYIKGEDKLLRAAAKLAEEEKRFKLILVEWGNSVVEIKKYIAQLGKLQEHVIWIQPVSQKELFAIYQNVEAVIDQLYLNAYGAITFEVLAAHNSALISNSTEEDLQRKFFGDKLPCYSCKNEEDVLKALREVNMNSERYRKYVNRSREWICEHHSNERIAEVLDLAMSYCDV